MGGADFLLSFAEKCLHPARRAGDVFVTITSQWWRWPRTVADAAQGGPTAVSCLQEGDAGSSRHGSQCK